MHLESVQREMPLLSKRYEVVTVELELRGGRQEG